jgi:hypothetical protein
VRETPDWKDFMEKGAFNTTTMTGPEFRAWLVKAEADARAAHDRSRLHGQEVSGALADMSDPSVPADAPLARARRATAASTPSSRRCCSRSAPVVVYQARKLGAEWTSDGPGSGYFPFYIGLILCIASAGIFFQAMFSKKQDGAPSSTASSSGGCSRSSSGDLLRPRHRLRRASTSRRRSTSPSSWSVLGKYAAWKAGADRPSS